MKKTLLPHITFDRVVRTNNHKKNHHREPILRTINTEKYSSRICSFVICVQYLTNWKFSASVFTTILRCYLSREITEENVDFVSVKTFVGGRVVKRRREKSGGERRRGRVEVEVVGAPCASWHVVGRVACTQQKCRHSANRQRPPCRKRHRCRRHHHHHHHHRRYRQLHVTFVSFVRIGWLRRSSYSLYPCRCRTDTSHPGWGNPRSFD